MFEPRKSSIHDKRYRDSIEILIRYRKSADLSQSQLAELLGFSQPDISKIERLERRVDVTEFVDLLQAISNNDEQLAMAIWGEIYGCHR